MYLSAAGANVQSQRLQVLANNLANVSTPGFKRDFAVFQARHTEAIEQGKATPGSRTRDDIGGGLRLHETVTDFSTGTLQPTGNPSDVAIDGPGFFVVSKDGDQFLTKAGNFHFAADGRLLSEQGHQVLASDRQPIAINPALPWEFKSTGVLSQGSQQIPLAIVKPQSIGDLAKAGENLFSPLADVTDVPANARRIAAGFVEQSSVQPALEMMELIETSRVYEANVRMIQTQDQLLSALVNRVLRV